MTIGAYMHFHTVASHNIHTHLYSAKNRNNESEALNLDTKPISKPTTRNLFNHVGYIPSPWKPQHSGCISADCVFKATGTVSLYSAADFKPLGSYC